MSLHFRNFLRNKRDTRKLQREKKKNYIAHLRWKKVFSFWHVLYSTWKWRWPAKFLLLVATISRNIEQPLVGCWNDISPREATELRHLFYHRSSPGPRVWRVVDNLSSRFLFTHFSPPSLLLFTASCSFCGRIYHRVYSSLPLPFWRVSFLYLTKSRAKYALWLYAETLNQQMAMSLYLSDTLE